MTHVSIRKDDPKPPAAPAVIIEERGMWRGVSDEQTINAKGRRGYQCVHMSDNEMAFKPMNPPLRVPINWGR